MEPELYEALDVRLRRVEHEAAALRAELSRAAAAPSAAAAPQPAAAAAAPLPAASPPAAAAPGAVPQPVVTATATVPGMSGPARAPVSLEGLFAGRGLQLAGLFLVLLGTAFFLNLAFTRGWVGPVERIVLGLLAGVALVAEGIRRHRPGEVPVAEGLIGLGSGVLYLSLWAAVAVFPELHVPRLAAFVAMIAVTAVLAVVAATRRAERVALLGLIGGFLTPVLLSSDTPDRTVLAAYLFVLALGFAALGVRVRYRFVEGAAFVASALYLPVFAPAHGWSVAAAAVVTTALCALFAVAFAAGAARDRTASALRLTLLAVDAFAYAAMLGWIFSYRDTHLGIAFVALAAAFLLAARFVPVPKPMTVAYGYLGLSAATLALPALLHRVTLLDAFALEGAVLVVLGARRGDRYVTGAGAAIVGCASVWLLGWALITPPQNTAFSALALAFFITVAALIFARSELARTRHGLGGGGAWATAAGIVANVVAVAGISRVLLDALGGTGWDNAVPSHAQFAVSFAWTAYATTLFGLGMRRGSALLLRLGLALFALTIFKVFTIDLSNVEVTWRIASFVVLGLVCLGVSAWYMRAQAAGREAQA